ncbi:hypothetical protein D3C79_1107710 [compost metagenome]
MPSAYSTLAALMRASAAFRWARWRDIERIATWKNTAQALSTPMITKVTHQSTRVRYPMPTMIAIAAPIISPSA